MNIDWFGCQQLDELSEFLYLGGNPNWIVERNEKDGTRLSIYQRKSLAKISLIKAPVFYWVVYSGLESLVEYCIQNSKQHPLEETTLKIGLSLAQSRNDDVIVKMIEHEIMDIAIKKMQIKQDEETKYPLATIQEPLSTDFVVDGMITNVKVDDVQLAQLLQPQEETGKNEEIEANSSSSETTTVRNSSITKFVDHQEKLTQVLVINKQNIQDWETNKDENGRIYYYNKATNVSTWVPPMVVDETMSRDDHQQHLPTIRDVPKERNVCCNTFCVCFDDEICSGYTGCCDCLAAF